MLINVDIQHSISLFMELVASLDTGAVLLVGDEDAGKNTLLNSFCEVHSAEQLNFGHRQPLPSELTLFRLFNRHQTAVVDAFDFEAKGAQYIFSLLARVKRERKKIIIATSSPPDNHIKSFSLVIYLKANRYHRGWYIQCIDRTPAAIGSRKWDPVHGAITGADDQDALPSVAPDHDLLSLAQERLIERLCAGDKVLFQEGDAFSWEESGEPCTMTARSLLTSGYIRVDDVSGVVLTRAGLAYAKRMGIQSGH